MTRRGRPPLPPDQRVRSHHVTLPGTLWNAIAWYQDRERLPSRSYALRRLVEDAVRARGYSLEGKERDGRQD